MTKDKTSETIFSTEDLEKEIEYFENLRRKYIIDLNYCYVKECGKPAIKYFENKKGKSRRFYCESHTKKMLKQEIYKNWDLRDFNYKDYEKVENDDYINLLKATLKERQRLKQLVKEKIESLKERGEINGKLVFVIDCYKIQKELGL